MGGFIQIARKMLGLTSEATRPSIHEAIQTKSLDKNYYLGEVTRILSHPSDFLTAEHAAMHFDRMGILLDGKTNEEKDDLQVLEVKLGDTFRRSCVILKGGRNTLIKKQAPNV